MAKVTVKRQGQLRRPDLQEIAVAQVHDKYSGYPSNGLTPTRLAAIFREADSGDVLRQMELFEEFEEKDPHLFSQLQTRKNAVTGLDYEIVPFDSDDDRDKEIARFIEKEIGGLEGFEDIQMDLLDAIGKGFAVSEIMWGYDEGRTVIKEIISRHQKRFFWDTLDDSFKVRTQEAPQGIFLPENKFIVHRYKARSGHPSRAGVLRVVAWMYLFKNYDLKDWLSFCEVYGMPLRLGKYPTGASPEDRAALRQALIQIGADAAGIIPDGTTIDFITTEKASSTDLFERLARFCDEQMSKAILGQTLTSDSGGGSFAQSKTHNEVRHDLTVADCKALAGTLRRDLIRPLVLYNYGEDKRIPYIRYDCEEAEDLEQTAKIIGTLIKDTGLKVSTGYIYKKFSIPKPEATDEIARPMQQANPFSLSLQPPGNRLELKAPGVYQSGQQDIDALADAAIGNSAGMFKAMCGPLYELVNNAASMEDIAAILSDSDKAAQLAIQMGGADIEDILGKAMFLADLKGRMLEYG